MIEKITNILDYDVEIERLSGTRTVSALNIKHSYRNCETKIETVKIIDIKTESIKSKFIKLLDKNHNSCDDDTVTRCYAYMENKYDSSKLMIDSIDLINASEVEIESTKKILQKKIDKFETFINHKKHITKHNYKNINIHELEETKEKFRHAYKNRNIIKNGSLWVNNTIDLRKSLNKLKKLKEGFSDRYYIDNDLEALKMIEIGVTVYCVAKNRTIAKHVYLDGDNVRNGEYLFSEIRYTNKEIE